MRTRSSKTKVDLKKKNDQKKRQNVKKTKKAAYDDKKPIKTGKRTKFIEKDDYSDGLSSYLPSEDEELVTKTKSKKNQVKVKRNNNIEDDYESSFVCDSQYESDEEENEECEDEVDYDSDYLSQKESNSISSESSSSQAEEVKFTTKKRGRNVKSEKNPKKINIKTTSTEASDDEKTLIENYKNMPATKLEKINKNMFTREKKIYKKRKIKTDLLKHEDIDPEAFIKTVRQGSKNFYNTANIDKSNINQVSQALSVVNVRIFQDRFLGIENICRGLATGDMEIALPAGGIELLTFRNEEAYAGEASFEKDGQMIKTTIYYRSLCFNPFRGSRGVVSSTVTFVPFNSNVPKFINYPQDYYDLFEERRKILQLRNPRTETTIFNSEVKGYNLYLIVDNSPSMTAANYRLSIELQKYPNSIKTFVGNCVLLEKADGGWRNKSFLKQLYEVIEVCQIGDIIMLFADFQDPSDTNFDKLIECLRRKNLVLKIVSVECEPNLAFKNVASSTGAGGTYELNRMKY